MKAEKILKNVLDFGGKSINIEDDIINSEAIEGIKEHLLECDEFKDVDELEVIKIPNVEDKSGSIIHSQTYIMSDNIKFKKRCYIHSISLTPELFDSKKIHTPVKNGCYITPTEYDPIDLTPKRTICIGLSLEELKDTDNGKDNSKRKELHKLLDDILDNQKEYESRGERKIMIRGIFEEVEINGGVSKQDIGELNLDYDNQKNFMVCYISRKISGQEVKLSVETEYLPMKYKKQFESVFDGENSIKEEDFIKFKKSIE